MSLNYLPCDLIFNILDYTWCEYDLKLVKALNKRFLKLMSDYGTAREINVCYDSDMKSFINRYIKNKKSLRSLTICRIENPTIWIPCEWPQIVEFIGCNISNCVSPPVVSNTRELYIKTYSSHYNSNSAKTLSINLKKLPYLETLKVRCFNFDFNCLKYAKNLRKFHLVLINHSCKRKRDNYLNKNCKISFVW